VTLNFRRGPAWEDHAYNVPRADFDRILLDHAIKEGAVVREGVEVCDVGLRDDGVRLAVRRARWLRPRRGQPVESQLSW
jgi:flavin-dependent dehydrogenase